MDATILAGRAGRRQTPPAKGSAGPAADRRPSLARRVLQALKQDVAAEDRISTPKLLRWGLAAIVAATCIAIPVALVAVGRLEADAVAIVDEDKPTFLLSEQAAATLADMATQVTDSALGQGQAWPRYGADVAASVSQVTAAIGAARNDPDEISRFEKIQVELRHFAQLVGASSVTSPDVVIGNEELAKTQTLWAARDARSVIAPLAEEATEHAALRLANAERQFLDHAGTAGRALAAVLVALLAVLVTTQLIITRRTRRLINIPLALATLVMLGAIGWTVAVIRTADTEVVADGGRVEHLRQLYDAKVTALAMKADQSMWLFELRKARFEQRELRASYGRNFSREAARLLDAAGVAGFAGALVENGAWTDPVDHAVLAQTAGALDAAAQAYDAGKFAEIGALQPVIGGVLGQELAHAAAAGEGWKPSWDAVAWLLRYLEIDRQIRQTAIAANRDEAVLMSIGDSDGSATAAFVHVVAGLDRLVAIDLARSQATDHELVGSLDRFRILLLAALTATLLLAVPGVWQRYREYL